jgi:hypothetical protein
VVALQNEFSPVDVQLSQEYFRLTQELQSGGDIFEIESGVKALVLGPESDVSDLLVTFFDKQSPTNVNQVVISSRSPFIGRVDVLLATQIPSAQTQARIQVSVRDLVDNTFLPYTFSQDDDFFAARIKPRIDLLSYFSNPGLLPQGRADRQYFFPFISTAAPPSAAWYALPYYGRRYAHLSLTNQHAAAATTYTLQVFGINFSAGAAQGGGGKWAQTLLDTLTAVQFATDNGVVLAATAGMFDMLALRMTNTVGLFDPDSTLRVTVSDLEG